MAGSIPLFRLEERGGNGLCRDVRGVALGPIALVEAAEANGRRVYSVRPADEVARALAVAYDPFTTEDLARRLSGLDVAARALEAGDMAKAMVVTVLMKLPPLSAAVSAKLARDPTLKKYSPDQPRDERGRWTSDGASAAFAGGREGTDASAHAKPVQLAQNNAADTMTDAVADAGQSPMATDAKEHPWMTRSNKEFRNFVAGEEHSATSSPRADGYDEDNGDALGRYQLQKTTSLKAIGWVDPRCTSRNAQYCTWTAEAAKHGVMSDEDFLNNREAQETAFDLVMREDEKQARQSQITIKGADGAEERVSLWELGQRRQAYTDSRGKTVTITPAGVMGALHRVGTGGAHRFLSRLARNGWTTRRLPNHSKTDDWASQRLIDADAQNVPYTSSQP